MSSLRKKSSFDRRRNYSVTKVPPESNLYQLKRMTAHQYEKTIKELLEKIEMLESRLVETGMDKIKIVTSHQKLRDENNFLKTEVKSSEKINKELNLKNINTSQKIDAINRQIKDMRSSYENKFDIMLTELRKKSDDINDLVDKIKVKENKILDMKMSYDLTNKEIEKQMNELEMLKLINKTQEQKINKLEIEINKLYMEKKCEGNLLMENKHLKDDNVRLVELLSLTEEFSNFGYLNQSLPGGIRYVSEINLPELPRARKKAIKQRIDSLNSWVPGMAYDVMLQFNLEHDLNMDEVLINELLGKLNQVFREKVEKNVTRITAKYQKQILNLMNKYGIKNIAAPYNFVEVEQVKKGVAKIIKKEQKNEELKKKREQKADEITNFAKTATSRFFWNHKKKLDEEIFDLKEKLSIKIGDNNKCNIYNRLDNSSGSGFRTNYGSTADSFGNVIDKKMNNFYIERMIKEINSIIESFEELVNEYRTRIKDTEIDFGNDINSQKSCIKILKKNIDWLISSMNDILKDSKNQFRQMKKIIEK